MEIEADDGRKLSLKANTSTIFGRGNKLVPNDLTISRRHIIFELNSQPSEPSRVSFEVIGRNPIWVKRKSEQSDDEQTEIEAFKRFERGELGASDMFCLSGKDPVWFKVKRVEEEQGNGREEEGKNEGKVKELGESLEMDSGFDEDGELGYESVDVANIDPVKEFGFLVIGHEFDQYPKQMIRDIKTWDWFIDDLGEGNTDEEDGENSRKRRVRNKRKRSKGKDDDEEWTTDEAGDEKEMIAKARKIRKAEYHTRSKDRGRSSKDTKSKKGLAKKKSVQVKEEEIDDDEDDETLGGFIVDNNAVDEEEEESEEEEEEEEKEFEEDEDDE